MIARGGLDNLSECHGYELTGPGMLCVLIDDPLEVRMPDLSYLDIIQAGEVFHGSQILLFGILLFGGL